MTIETKPTPLPSWAESGDVIQPSNAELQEGWPLTNTPPARQRFNWFFNYVMAGVHYFMQRGVPAWDATEDYPQYAKAHSLVDNKTYTAKIANTNKEPSANSNEWERWGYSLSDLLAAMAANLYAKLNATQTFTKAQRGAIVALSDSATITPNFADGNNFSVTLGGNRTLANPSNLVAGQTGSIYITQDSAGGRSLAFGSYWKFESGVAPVLLASASGWDELVYSVKSSTQISAAIKGDVQ